MGNKIIIHKKDIARLSGQTHHFINDTLHWSGSVGAAEKRGYCTKFTFIRTASGGLDHVFKKILLPGVQAPVGWGNDLHPGVFRLEIHWLQVVFPGIINNDVPKFIGLANDDGIHMGRCFFRHIWDMNATHHHLDSTFPKHIGNFIATWGQRRHGCDGNKIRGDGFVQCGNGLINICNGMFRRGQSCQGG